MTNQNNLSRLSYIIQTIKQSLRGEAFDYTEGSLRKAVFLLAVPMILELSLESVFAVVDMFFVSKLGPAAIATVGLTESVITIIYSVAIGWWQEESVKKILKRQLIQVHSPSCWLFSSLFC